MGLSDIMSVEAAASATVIEDGCSRFVRNVGICMAEYPKR
jgi:hypothetical protein